MSAMSEQLPEHLVNECAEVDFGSLKLYALVKGHRRSKPRWSNQYPFRRRPQPSDTAICAPLWRGAIAHYRLLADGRLCLQHYEYPFDPLQSDEAVEEILEGDFWLMMKSRFYGDCTYVPFREGRIVTDRSCWETTACDVEDTRERVARRRRSPF